MYDRLLKIRENKSFFLFGPRATGKTWWIKRHFPEALYLDLLDSELYMDLMANPKRLEFLISPKYDGWVLIDEVQKIPALLNEVHRLIETKGYKFVLTGSSARSLRKKGVNLLAGRALTYQMHPLTAAELGFDFSMKTSLKYGNLPSVFQTEDPQHYLKAYVGTYLREEVLQEGLTRNLGAFSRFLETSSFSQGQIINMAEIARETRIHRKVVESYFTILEDLLLARKLSVFTKRAKRELTVHPKFFFFDVGVYRAIRPTGPLDTEGEIEGASLETLLFQEMYALNDYGGFGYEFYYWRTRAGLEVDFVLYGNKGLVAIEVKRSRSIGNKDLKALQEFGKDYPSARLVILYGGDRKEYYGERIEAIPFIDVLKDARVLLSLG